MFADLLLLTNLHQERRDQPQTRNLVGEDTYYSRSYADFLIDPFQAVGGPEGPAVLKRKVKDRKSFCRVLLQPSGQAWS